MDTDEEPGHSSDSSTAMSTDDESEHSSDPKVAALQDALQARDPFYTGMCAIKDYQRLLYYTDDSGHYRRIDFANAGPEDLDALYRACKPAEFGRKGENLFDESYRKAGKMDLTSFSTLLDPRSLPIRQQVSKALLTDSLVAMEIELYKLNVYGERPRDCQRVFLVETNLGRGDFFKAHKDTPRGENTFGSLVVILPTPHEGGQFVLRQSKREWTIDFTDKFAGARTEPSACFIAFCGDVEHEVLPISSGYRVTLTYNLYHEPIHPTAPSIPTPFHVQLRQALADLVNDSSKLPKGGYLGFGLAHEYVHKGYDLLEPLLRQLKGADRALVDTCDALGLCYSLRLLYRDICSNGINLLTTQELDVEDTGFGMDMPYHEYLYDALRGLTCEQVEGFFFVDEEDRADLKDHSEHFVNKFYRSPVTEVLEVTTMTSTVDIESAVLTWGNETEVGYFYGTACMLIAVEPTESRRPIVL